MPRTVSLTALPDRYAICRLDPGAPAATWMHQGEVSCIFRSGEETSVLCTQSAAPDSVKANKGWRVLRFDGTFDFEQVGLLASVLNPLAVRGVSVLALSSFDTDYVLVQQGDLAKALMLLERAGHRVAIRHKDGATLRITDATTSEELDVARTLFREYAAALPFSLCFQGFDQELAALPSKYARPDGCILLAWNAETPVGCIAVRPIEAMNGDATPVCEMKRMFVRPAARGLGVGRLLAERLLAEARDRGYATMKLDSEPDFAAAMALYRSLGFTNTPRYNDDPHPQTVFMAMRL